MERKQFTFYSSFFDALSKIRKKADKADAYDAICAYALTGEEPDLEKLSDAASIAFLLIKPNLDASKRKANSGRAGGKSQANGKQTESKSQANGKQTESKSQANGKRGENTSEKEKEGEREKENDSSLSVVSLTQFHAPTFDEVSEYNRLRGGLIDPKPFYDYYAAANWRDGEGKPVRNWQQKFIAWELRELDKRKGARNGPEHHDGGDAGKKWDVPGAVYL